MAMLHAFKIVLIVSVVGVQCERNYDRDGKDMSISERRQCYVYGQCQVMNISWCDLQHAKFMLHALIGLFIWLDINVMYPHRNTPLTSACKKMLKNATHSAARWTGATGGPGSRICHSAWLFKTAQDQECPVIPSALIASAGRNCENTFTTQEKFL